MILIGVYIVIAFVIRHCLRRIPRFDTQEEADKYFEEKGISHKEGSNDD